MKKVTVWKIYNKENLQYEHNHIEDGHSEKQYPIPLNDSNEKPFPMQLFKMAKNSYISRR